MSDEKNTKATPAAAATYRVSDGPKAVVVAGKDRFAGSVFSVTAKEAEECAASIAWLLSTGALSVAEKK